MRNCRLQRKRSSHTHELLEKYQTNTSILVFCISLALYGSINARNVVMNEHTWTAEGLKQPHTFAYASDIHAEDDHMIKNLIKFRDQVNSMQPDPEFFGGRTYTDEQLVENIRAAGVIIVTDEYEKPHIKLYMTSGVGGWAIPFRTESHSAWEYITLTP